MPSQYLPEGRLSKTIENQSACASLPALAKAMEQEQILEGRVLLCDAEHNLTVAVGPFVGTIPRSETALGIAEGTTREIAILSRVGKPVSFLVQSIGGPTDRPVLILSRRRAQERALAHFMTHLTPGDIIPATVTHLEPFGAFVDIGCGFISMIGIEHISVSRIPHPGIRFTVGQEIYVAVRSVDRPQSRVILTHKELLGTWAENAAQFTPGMTVPGYVRGMKEYGAFVELTANLSGLAELRPDLMEGDRVSVYIKAILPERMKIKLLAIDRLPPVGDLPQPLRYFTTEGRLTHWRYAPPGCTRPGMETDFTLPP